MPAGSQTPQDRGGGIINPPFHLLFGQHAHQQLEHVKPCTQAVSAQQDVFAGFEARAGQQAAAALTAQPAKHEGLHRRAAAAASQPAHHRR